jgi:hypothetical protein
VESKDARRVDFLTARPVALLVLIAAGIVSVRRYTFDMP